MPDPVHSFSRPTLVLEPPRRWAAVSMRDIWEFRDLFRAFASRDIKLRYKQTTLGVIWVVLQPLLAAGIFTFVFGKVAKLPSDGVPYVLFSYAGLMAWTLFSQTVAKASGVMVGNAAMVTKVYFPRILLPLSVVASSLLDLMVAAGLFAVLLAVYGVAPGVPLLAAPLWIALAIFLALGLGLTVTALAVRYRDIQYILPVLLQMLLYASPVAYGLRVIPEQYQDYAALNPLTGILEGIRWSLLDTTAPTSGQVLSSVVVSVVALVAGAFVFASTERDFADVI